MGAARTPRSRRKADIVADTLLARIAQGQIPVGSTLPNESELAADFNVNRSVVREAVKFLEVHNVLRPVRRRGTLVLDPRKSLSPAVLGALMRPSQGGVDPAFFAGFLEVRATIDASMCALAAERRTKADLKAIDDLLDRLRADAHDLELFAQHVQDLATVLARATHNPVYEMLVEWHGAVSVGLDHVFATVRSATSQHVQGFEVLAGCIREKDAQGARDLITNFHAWATPRLLAAAKLASGT
jgi:GntR family transcriptional regulator, transcriptional repressor for pyruvate dehydrogenase complex